MIAMRAPAPTAALHPEAAFREAMQQAGIDTAAPIVADGHLRRFHVAGDRRGSVNGWYVLHADAPACGWFGSWRTGFWGKWYAGRREEMTPAERDRIGERARAARAARRAEEARRHAAAQVRAGRIWRQAEPANADHPYLNKKQVRTGVARQQGDRLVLPVTDLDGVIWSLQFIGADGSKMLLRDGRKRDNCIHVAGAMPGASRVLIAEGWATAMTLAEMDPDALVLAAVDAYNLAPVAVAVRRKWPEAELVICADDDREAEKRTGKNPGVENGRAAAVAAGARIAFPEFPDGVDGSDFNDLAVALRGRA